MERVPVSSCDLTGREAAYAVEAIESSWISGSGRFVDRFEREFAECCGTRTAIGVSNGTVALHLALLALGAGPGDEVLVPALTYVASANAIRYVGAEPVLVDVDPQTWCISPEAVEASISPRTRGIMSVSLYGHPADMDRINEVARAHDLWVVDDAAEAHLALYKNRPVGSLATISTFSFYGNKILTCGEGGALTLDDQALERRARLFRGQGMDPERRYFHPVVGYNFRLSNVLCAILCAQLERRESILAYRRRIYAGYVEVLSGIPGIACQVPASWATIAPWLFSITVDETAFGRSRDQLMQLLNDQGIETRPFFVPLHELPPYRDCVRRPDSNLAVSERLGAAGLNLPTHVGVTREVIDRVGDVIRGVRR